MNIEKTFEDYFWAYLFRFSVLDPKQQARVKPRLAFECQTYVLLKMAETLKQPTADIYPGTSEQFLAETEDKCRQFCSEERDRTSSPTSETGKKWWQFWK